MSEPLTSFDNPHGPGFYVSSENRMLDFQWLNATLLNTGWGSKWTHEIITEAVRNSICFGVYERTAPESDERGNPVFKCADRQVGFCRVVTDTITFSWLCDVVIDPKFRGRGLGKFLIRQAISHPSVKRTRCFLKTQRPKFYEPIGFSSCEAMRRLSDLE